MIMSEPEARGPEDHERASSLIIAAPFSPIMIVGALVLPVVSVGITEASITRRPWMPRTRSARIDDGARVLAHLAGADRVIERVAGAAGIGQQVGVALDVGAGRRSRPGCAAPAPVRQRRGAHGGCRPAAPARRYGS